MTTKNPSKSIRTFIRKEKSRIRHSNPDLVQQKILIDELQKRFH
jgi:hypothetical protein